ncbi:Phosphomethylpyrimidine synthase [Frankliniella fusca]|uniref:Phosphomethylpyrimidine synthase n=1 Tax=Frankliniella fusca TaxID=407009 RepID=A0AAE1LM05_9NEOP|nr:Phosphomethylpyrimidine synthase [Frankliniella fusca]
MADGGDLTAAQHLQAEAAQLISDVKCKFRTSQKAVDYVVSGVDKLTDINIDVTKDLLKKRLADDDGHLYLSQVNAVLDSQRGQSLFEGVKSRKSLDAFIAAKAGVEPEEKLMQIILETQFTTKDGKAVIVPKDYGYYISFLPQLEQLLNCPDVLHSVLNPAPAPKGVYRSITDGLYYKHHFLVKQHGNKVLAITVYCDDVEFADPCKTKAKVHKLRLYYWCLGNIPPKFRSTLKSINLLAIVKSSLTKKYGNGPFMEDFIQGIIKLGGGVCFSILGKEYLFHGILLCSCGDMPAQTNLGGFKETHFALRPCRHCMVLRTALCNSFHEDKTLLRNIVAHNQYIKEIESYTPPAKKRKVIAVPVTEERTNDDEAMDDLPQENPTQNYQDHEDPSVNYGINQSSILALAPGFDVTKCLPIDILHTLHEGILNDLCRLLIRDLCLTQKDSSGKVISKPKYSLKFLSDFFKERCNFGHLNVNKPSEIEKSHLSSKLKQSAAQMYVLGHILPFFTKDLPDEKHQLLLKLLKILDITMLFEIKEENILELEQLVVDFGTSFVAVYVNHKTLKLHSLRHLGMLGRLFGGFRQVWCFRFEAMHRLLTSLVDVVNNMKNIELTMATRYILRRDTELVSGKDGTYLYDGDSFSGLQSLQENEVDQGDLLILKSHITINKESKIMMAKTMEKNGCSWSENVVFLKSGSAEPSFGLIKKKIYVIDDEVLFLYSNLKTEYDESVHAYRILAECSPVKVSPLG